MNLSNVILPILILLPIIGAVCVTLVGNGSKDEKASPLAGLTALGFSTLTLILSLAVVLTGFIKAAPGAGYLFEFQADFLPQLGSSFHFGVDGISLWLIILTNILCPLAIWASFTGIKDNTRCYYALMLILQAGMTGVFVSMDMLIFYVFYEFTLVPLFLIVGIWGGLQRQKAAFKLFIYTMAGGVLTLGGILYVAWQHYLQTQIATFEITALYQTVIDSNAGYWLFFAFFAGFAVKVPLFPLHTWLPLAHTEAPTAGSVLLAGVLLKLGTYGFMRILLPLLPTVSYELAGVVGILAIIGIIYGSLCAWIQTDIKKLVAYSSVAHLGFCMLGMFAFNHAGLSGALLYMVNHGLSTGALFLVVGMIYERYHTREFSQLGGLARKMPVMAFFMILFSLSSIGLPGLNGFISEFTILYAVFTSKVSMTQVAGPLGPKFAIVAATGVVLSAIYMLWMCQRVLFGPVKEPASYDESHSPLPVDLARREWLILTPLAILVVILGVYPKLFFTVTDPAIEKLNGYMVSVVERQVAAKEEHAMLLSNDQDLRPVVKMKEIIDCE